MNCSCLKCDWPESENKKPRTLDTARLQLSHMTCELAYTTRRRTVLNETMSHLSRRTSHIVHLLVGDVPGLTMYCGKKQSHKTSSLRLSSASSSVRSCFNRATNFDRNSRFAPSAPDLMTLAFQGLILTSRTSNCHNSVCFNLAAFVATGRDFPRFNCVVRFPRTSLSETHADVQRSKE